MTALQIRNVPETTRDALKEQASARGQSLQAYLLELVEAQARRQRNVAILNRFAWRSDGVASAPGQTVDELREQRGARSAPGACSG